MIICNKCKSKKTVSLDETDDETCVCGEESWIETMDPEIYDEIINNEQFLNDLWNKYGNQDKLSALKLSGWTDEMLVKEFAVWNDEFNRNNNEPLPL